MFEISTYNLVILSVAGGLLSLLGSVGIFVSLIIQRRVERLQEILEELVDLSYQSEQNLTSNIYRLIQQYQMYYILPHGPSKTIMYYLDFTMALVMFSWLSLLYLALQPPLRLQTFTLLLPILGGLCLMVFFRRLLQNAINPLENEMLNAIIPPPVQLRSVSFLSRYVNVSVRSLLQQARLGTVIRKSLEEDKEGQSCEVAEVVLKEELSFDDFFYYFSLPLGDKQPNCSHFVAFGHLQISFPPDRVTGKPVPVERNINIPLGRCKWQDLPGERIEARLVVFPLGEKHPISYLFFLHEEKNYFAPQDDSHIAIDREITFTVKGNQVIIIEGEDKLPLYELSRPWLKLSQGRKYINVESPAGQPAECAADIYIR